jgi:hypothetical protein
MKDSTLFDFDNTEAPPDERRGITVCHVDEEYDTYGGRERGNRHLSNTAVGDRGWLGNPYRLADHSRSTAIEKFTETYRDRLRSDEDFVNAVLSLEGDRVACHCRHSTERTPACHLDVVNESFQSGLLYSAAMLHGIALTETERALAEGGEGVF